MAAATQPFRKVGFSTGEAIWYVVECVAFGAGYIAKVPAKKALQDFGLAEMTSAERFWYRLQCAFFGAGYFAKLPIAKALSELSPYRTARLASIGKLEPAFHAATLPPRPAVLVPAASAPSGHGR